MNIQIGREDILSVEAGGRNVVGISDSSALFCADSGYVKVLWNDDTLTVELCPYIKGKQGQATVLSVAGEVERQS